MSSTFIKIPCFNYDVAHNNFAIYWNTKVGAGSESVQFSLVIISVILVISPSHLSMMASDSDLMAFIFAPFSGITCALAISG